MFLKPKLEILTDHELISRISKEDTDNPPDITNGKTACSSLLQKEVSNILATAIQKLPENQRAALLLRHMEEMRYAEIAEVMDKSIGAVESLLVRARKTLKEHMDDLGYF